MAAKRQRKNDIKLDVYNTTETVTQNNLLLTDGGKKKNKQRKSWTKRFLRRQNELSMDSNNIEIDRPIEEICSVVCVSHVKCACQNVSAKELPDHLVWVTVYLD